jgi:hypothetical protein
MDRLTRAFYATSAAALMSFAAIVIVLLVAAAPGFSVAQDRARAASQAPVSMIVGDFHNGGSVQAG